MKINFSRLESEGFRFDVEHDESGRIESVDIFPAFNGIDSAFLDTFNGMLEGEFGLGPRDLEDVHELLHDLQVMAAIRRASGR